jgi:hypothetical protein
VLKDLFPIRDKIALRVSAALVLRAAGCIGWQDASPFFFTLFCLASLTSAALGAAKPHVISFGKWTTIKRCVGPNEGKCLG